MMLFEKIIYEVINYTHSMLMGQISLFCTTDVWAQKNWVGCVQYQLEETDPRLNVEKKKW